MYLKIIDKDNKDELKLMKNYKGSVPQVGQIIGFINTKTGLFENEFKIIDIRWITTNDYEDYTFTCEIYVGLCVKETYYR